MSKTSNFLPPADSPPKGLTDCDVRLRSQLSRSISRLFFDACDSSTQSLLKECDWAISTHASLTLSIDCSTEAKNLQVLNHIVVLVNHLYQFSPSIRIRVYPPVGTGVPFDMRANERVVY